MDNKAAPLYVCTRCTLGLTHLCRYLPGGTGELLPKEFSLFLCSLLFMPVVMIATHVPHKCPNAALLEMLPARATWPGSDCMCLKQLPSHVPPLRAVPPHRPRTSPLTPGEEGTDTQLEVGNDFEHQGWACDVTLKDRATAEQGQGGWDVP